MKNSLCDTCCPAFHATGYGTRYNRQLPNEALPMFGLNAPREVHVPHETDGLIWCGDAETTETIDHDELIATDMYEFFDDKVYANFVSIEEIDKYKRIGWLDLLSKEVTMSTMIYTQGIELFTLAKVDD